MCHLLSDAAYAAPIQPGHGFHRLLISHPATSSLLSGKRDRFRLNIEMAWEETRNRASSIMRVNGAFDDIVS